jgi:hypothetical protein
MTTADIISINQKRLGNWGADLAAAHSTPLLLLGVGHDDVSGRPMVITVDDVSDEQLIVLLSLARAMLVAKKEGKAV